MVIVNEDDRVYLINPKTNEFVRTVDEELIRHHITEWRHPDSCPDCAANPEGAKVVQVGEAAVVEATKAMLPFFSGNPDPLVLMHLFMSGFTACHKYMNEHMAKTNPWADNS